MKLLRRTLGALLMLIMIGAGALHLRVEHLVNRPVPTTVDPAYVATGDQYYFAYGSNMSTRYLYNVRGIRPAQSQPGVIENHQVSFLTSGTVPAFAYLMKAENKKAYGVLHRVSKQDLDKIKASEGAEYDWATLPVQLGNGQAVPAQTLLRLTPGNAGKPSRRYLRLLIEGAAEHALPAEYVASLQSMQSTYVPVVSELMGDGLQAAVMISSGKCASLLTC